MVRTAERAESAEGSDTAPVSSAFSAFLAIDRVAGEGIARGGSSVKWRWRLDDSSRSGLTPVAPNGTMSGYSPSKWTLVARLGRAANLSWLLLNA